MGHLGPVQARYDVLPVPALTTADVAAAEHEPAATSPERRRPERKSPESSESPEHAPTPPD